MGSDQPDLALENRGRVKVLEDVAVFAWRVNMYATGRLTLNWSVSLNGNAKFLTVSLAADDDELVIVGVRADELWKASCCSVC